MQVFNIHDKHTKFQIDIYTFIFTALSCVFIIRYAQMSYKKHEINRKCKISKLISVNSFLIEDTFETVP